MTDSFHALFEAVLENRDAEAFANLWVVDDPTVTMWGSDLDERATGLDQVRALGAGIAGSKSDLRFHWETVQLHERGEVAWVNAAGHLTVDGEHHPYRLTAVLLHTYAGWRWHTFSGSIPDA